MRIIWEDGSSDVIDTSPALTSRRMFIPLRTDDALFRTLRVSEFGDAIVWDNGAELSAVWLEELAPASLDNVGFRQAMDELGMTLDGMAARLGIARRLVADYRKDKPIPPYIAMATRYMVERMKKAS